MVLLRRRVLRDRHREAIPVRVQRIRLVPW
jgi:hypothetical protein